MKKHIGKTAAVSLITAAAIFLGGVGTMATDEEKNVNPWYFDVTVFGATPNDSVDDTEAIKLAMATSGTAYFPAGEYIITGGLSLANLSIVGEGSDKTIITADISDAKTPIIRAGSRASMTGVTIRFKDGLVTGEEKEGERVGIYAATDMALQRGSAFTDVKIENVGTGIASGLGLFKGAEDVVFSVTFDNFVIQDFSFRGFDFRSNTRTGNYYKDVTVSSGKYSDGKNVDSAIYMVGEESESAIDSLTVKDTIAETPIVFERMNAISAKTVKLDNVYALHYPIITWNSSAGSIDNLIFDYCDTHFSENSLIRVGKVKYIEDAVQTLNSLHIGNLKLNSFNATNADKIIDREENATGDFYFTVDNYIVKNSDFLWDDFPADESKIIITKKGDVATEGETSDRPDKCLCPYYTRFYDTTLGKTVVWNGKEWK